MLISLVFLHSMELRGDRICTIETLEQRRALDTIDLHYTASRLTYLLEDFADHLRSFTVQ